MCIKRRQDAERFLVSGKICIKFFLAKDLQLVHRKAAKFVKG